MDALRRWFDGLSQREQLLVASAGVLVLVAVLVIGLIRPITGSAASSAERVEQREALLADIQRVAERLGPQRGAAGGTGPAAGSGQSLVLTIDRTTRSRGLAAYLKRNQPDGDEAIRLRFENAPFDSLVAWLAELQTVYGLATVSASIDAGNEPGRVSANLQIGRPAG